VWWLGSMAQSIVFKKVELKELDKLVKKYPDCYPGASNHEDNEKFFAYVRNKRLKVCDKSPIALPQLMPFHSCIGEKAIRLM